MSVVKYSELDDFPVGVRLFQDTVNRMLDQNARPWVPAVDIFETENEWFLKADLPEVKLEDIDIQVESGTLTVKGDRKFDKTSNGKGYQRVERSDATFARYFTLPETVDSEHGRADYSAGGLTGTLPQQEMA